MTFDEVCRHGEFTTLYILAKIWNHWNTTFCRS